MRYKIKYINAYSVSPKRTYWQFVAYPLLSITRNDIISGQPRICLSINWLCWGLGICVVFEKK